MKMIEVTVSASKLDRVQDAMRAAGTHGMTVSNVTRFSVAVSKKNGRNVSARRAERVEEVKIEVVVPDGFVRQVLMAVEEVTGSDHFDNGGVRLLDVEGAVRIRTAERGYYVV
jgi:nitrogen regulatory protein P-II 1